jgi:hypothetical protein
MTVSLPKGENNVGANNWSDVYGNDKALKEAVEALQTTSKGVTWYTPKVIATEETRENTAFGTLTTADEITGVALPENGLIVMGYVARWKSSVSEAGRAGLFLNTTQVRNGLNGFVEPKTTATENCLLTSAPGGLASVENAGAGPFPTTGVTLGHQSSTSPAGGIAHIYAAAGTYTVSVRFRATSGSVTTKERKLWVAVLGG